MSSIPVNIRVIRVLSYVSKHTCPHVGMHGCKHARIHTDMYSQVFSVVVVDADGKDLVVVGTCLLSCASLPPPTASLLVT